MKLSTKIAAQDLIKQYQVLMAHPAGDGGGKAHDSERFDWLALIKDNLDVIVLDDSKAFVAGSLPWYPVEADPTISITTDVMVVFGRQKERRHTYLQWQEAGIAPQVVFEIIAPGTYAEEIAKKFEFYERYGVEEYYLYTPSRIHLEGWIRSEDRQLKKIAEMQNWRSPRLGIHFLLIGLRLQLFHPDGSLFQSYTQLSQSLAQMRDGFRRVVWNMDEAEERIEQVETRIKELEARLHAANLL